jgi:uncharacterized membrane protein
MRMVLGTLLSIIIIIVIVIVIIALINFVFQLNVVMPMGIDHFRDILYTRDSTIDELD